MNGAGQLCRMKLGNTMQEDFEAIMDFLVYLASVAAAQYKANTLNCKQIDRLGKQMHDKISYINVLAPSLNILMKVTKILYPLYVINQALSALEFIVHSLLHTKILMIPNTVYAMRYRVNSSLYPSKDLTKVLEYGKNEHDLKAIFSIESILA